MSQRFDEPAASIRQAGLGSLTPSIQLPSPYRLGLQILPPLSPTTTAGFIGKHPMDATVWNKQQAMKALQLIAVERRYTPLAQHRSDSTDMTTSVLPRTYVRAFH
jgi:hypothetical protein